MQTRVTSAQRLAIVGAAFLGCFLLTLAAFVAFRKWKERPPHHALGVHAAPSVSHASGGIRPGEGDVPAHLERPDALVAARMEWSHLKEAYQRESEDEIRFALTKFRRLGVNTASVLVPVLKRGPEASDQVLAFAALAHARPGGEASDLEAMLLAQSLDEALGDPGHGLALNTLFDTRSRPLKRVVLLGLGSPTLPWGTELLRKYLADAGPNEEAELLLLAVRSTAEAGGEEARRVLIALLGRPVPDEVKNEAAALLTQMPGEGLDADIARLLQEAKTPEDKIRLVGLLTAMAGKEGSSVVITERMKDDLRPILIDAIKAGTTSDALKEQALRALGGLGDERSLEALAAALKSLVTPELARLAGEELGKYGQPAVGYSLVEAMDPTRYSVNELARLSSAMEIADRARQLDLKQQAVEKGAPYLKRILEETQLGSIKQESMAVLAQMGGQVANPILWDVAANPKEHEIIRKRAIMLLQDSGGPAEAQELMGLYDREKSPGMKEHIQTAIQCIQARAH